MGRRSIDLTDQRFGRLLVLRQDINAPHGTGIHHRWICRCDCGKEISTLSSCLRGGNSKSCGCWASDRIRAVNHVHGHYGTKAYWRWKGMMDRCYKKKSPSFKWYGARGISVCKQWHEFAVYYKDTGEQPAPGLTLDRKDNNGNYEPENMRWATLSVQNKNRRKPQRLAA
jgi:hypothetical protein